MSLGLLGDYGSDDDSSSPSPLVQDTTEHKEGGSSSAPVSRNFFDDQFEADSSETSSVDEAHVGAKQLTRLQCRVAS